MEQCSLIAPPDPQAVEDGRALLLNAAAGLRPILAEDHRRVWRERRDWGFWPDGVFIPFHDRAASHAARPTRMSPSAPRPRHP